MDLFNYLMQRNDIWKLRHFWSVEWHILEILCPSRHVTVDELNSPFQR
jgi:hypothetical protein